MSPRAARKALLMVLVLRLLLSLAYSALNPLGEAPDEADHYAYAAYIGTAHQLPADPAMTQAKHPPLYHVLAAAAAAAVTRMDFTFLRANPDVSVTPGVPGTGPNFFIHTRLEDWPWRDGALAMHLGRLVSVLAGLILTAATYALGRQIWPQRPVIALAGAVFVAFLPESLFIGAAMSNDMLAAALSALALWAGLAGTVEVGVAGAGPTRAVKAHAGRWAVLAGVLMGLCTLAKVSTAALWPVAALAMWLDGKAARGAPPGAAGGTKWLQACPRSLVHPCIALATALLVAAPWLWRNQVLYGDPFGTRFMLATVDRRQGPLTLGDMLWLARGWFFSFWGKFGGAGHIALPWPFYALWAALLLAALVGWVRWLRLARRGGCGLGAETRAAGHLVLWASPVLTAASIIYYTRLALGTDQGRLLFPALAPVGLWLAGGLAAWLPARRPALLPAGMATVMGLAGVLALGLGIWLPFSPPPAPPAQDLYAAQSLDRVFGDRLELTAATWAAGAASPGTAQHADNRTLVLYWQLRQPAPDDLRAVLRATAADGALLWEKKRSPGAGRFSTDHWPPARVVADVYAIPDDALRRAARVEIGVQSFGSGAWLPPGAPGQADFQALPAP